MATPAAAVDEKGYWSSGDWLEAQRKDDWERMSSHNWLAGFITGANAYRRGKVNYIKGIDNKSAALWINKYCAENPLEDSSDAATALIRELARRP